MFLHHKIEQGVCHTVALPFTLKGILRQKKNYQNSNISHFTKSNSSKICQGETKREGQKKAKKHTACTIKKMRASSLVLVRSYLTHGPSNVACTQIVRSNSNGRSITNSITNHKFQHKRKYSLSKILI